MIDKNKLMDFNGRPIVASGRHLGALQFLQCVVRHPSHVLYLRHWRKTLDSLDSEVAMPWVTYPAIHFLSKRLRKSFRLFEYGSGRSTLWFAERVGEVVSVEHDANWHDKLKRSLPFNAHLLHRPAEPLGSAPPPPPIQGSSPAISRTFQEYNGLDFSSYVLAINGYPDRYFDVIVVDGRARESCLFSAIAKVKQGGVVVLDNSERSRYVEAFEGLGYKVMRHFSGFGPGLRTMWRTSILRAPLVKNPKR